MSTSIGFPSLVGSSTESKGDGKGSALLQSATNSRYSSFPSQVSSLTSSSVSSLTSRVSGDRSSESKSAKSKAVDLLQASQAESKEQPASRMSEDLLVQVSINIRLANEGMTLSKIFANLKGLLLEKQKEIILLTSCLLNQRTPPMMMNHHPFIRTCLIY